MNMRTRKSFPPQVTGDTPTQPRAEHSLVPEAPAAPPLPCAYALPCAAATILSTVAAASLFRFGQRLGAALTSMPPAPLTDITDTDSIMSGVAPAPRFANEDWPVGSHAWAFKQNAKMDWLMTLPFTATFNTHLELDSMFETYRKRQTRGFTLDPPSLHPAPLPSPVPPLPTPPLPSPPRPAPMQPSAPPPHASPAPQLQPAAAVQSSAQPPLASPSQPLQLAAPIQTSPPPSPSSTSPAHNERVPVRAPHQREQSHANAHADDATSRVCAVDRQGGRHPHAERIRPGRDPSRTAAPKRNSLPAPH